MITYRLATQNDISLILDFIQKLAIYEHMEKEVIATTELLTEWLFEKQIAQVIFAIKEEKEVGFALYFYNFSTFLGRGGIHLEDLYVLEEYRGQKIGNGLLTYLAQIAVEKKCGRLEWNCLDWNQPSIDFYLSKKAIPLSDWTTYRLTGTALQELAQK